MTLRRRSRGAPTRKGPRRHRTAAEGKRERERGESTVGRLVGGTERRGGGRAPSGARVKAAEPTLPPPPPQTLRTAPARRRAPRPRRALEGAHAGRGWRGHRSPALAHAPAPRAPRRSALRGGADDDGSNGAGARRGGGRARACRASHAAARWACSSAANAAAPVPVPAAADAAAGAGAAPVAPCSRRATCEESARSARTSAVHASHGSSSHDPAPSSSSASSSSRPAPPLVDCGVPWGTCAPPRAHGAARARELGAWCAGVLARPLRGGAHLGPVERGVGSVIGAVLSAFHDARIIALSRAGGRHASPRGKRCPVRRKAGSSTQLRAPALTMHRLPRESRSPLLGVPPQTTHCHSAHECRQFSQRRAGAIERCPEPKQLLCPTEAERLLISEAQRDGHTVAHQRLSLVIGEPAWKVDSRLHPRPGAPERGKGL
jgi:hypothetical protein